MILQRIENTLTETAATIGPWLAPLPTAWLVGNSTMIHLGWPVWVAVIAGLVIELFGLGATGQALMLYEYNKSKRKSDPAAPVGLAIALVAGYFMVAVTLTVLLDTAPIMATYAPAIFPLLSLAGVGTLALRYDHRRRLLDIDTAKQERREKMAIKRVPNGVPERAIVEIGKYSDFEKVQVLRNGNGVMKAGEVMAQFGVPKRTAYNWIAKYRKRSEILNV